MSVKIIRCKDLQTYFGVCLSTAKKWRKEVRTHLGLAANQPISVLQWNCAAQNIKPAWQIKESPATAAGAN